MLFTFTAGLAWKNMRTELSDLLDTFKGEKEFLIPTLEKVQEEYGFISEEAVSAIADRAQMSDSEVFGVASFYSHFRFVPQGRHSIKVCLGTACHIVGGQRILEELERELGIKSGDTTEDLKFTLDSVHCLGCCAFGPVVVIDEKYYGKTTPAKAIEALKDYE